MFGLMPLPAIGAAVPVPAPTPENTRITEDGSPQVRVTEVGQARATEI